MYLLLGRDDQMFREILGGERAIDLNGNQRNF